MIAFVLSFLACAAYECTSAPLGNCANVETCCTSADCYYDADGEMFECDGTDCTSAATEVANYCTDTTGST